MSDARLIPVTEVEAWRRALAAAGPNDTYHRAEYHLLASQRGEGEPFLFTYTNGGHSVCLPFLRNPLSGLEGLEGMEGCDCTSVYGYPGIVGPEQAQVYDSGGFREEFHDCLRQTLRDLGVVALFSRTNPLIETSWLAEGFAEIETLSSTIAIDLMRSEVEQFRMMSKGHRYDIRKARQAGVQVEEDRDFINIDQFISSYNETMDRVGANAFYYFEREYYINLKEILGDCLRLYLAKVNTDIVSASLFLFSDAIIQYHLSGTPSRYLHLNASKVILDEVRALWSGTRMAWLHLGGGVGSSEDSLFRFKAGFSKSRHAFRVLRAVLNPSAYEEALTRRRRWADSLGLEWPETSYFPAYRARLDIGEVGAVDEVGRVTSAGAVNCNQMD